MRPGDFARAFAKGDLTPFSEQTDWPPVSRSLVEFLEKAFPPRCLSLGESVEQHLRYAGAVDLIKTLRTRIDKQADWSREDDLAEMVGEEI